MTQESHIPRWLLLSIGVVLLGSVYVFARQATTLPQASAIVTPLGLRPQASRLSPGMVSSVPIVGTETSIAVDTGNWSVYRNQEYGFQFMYPASWSIRISSGFDTPWSARLFPTATSASAITISTNLAYDTPREAAEQWSKIDGFQNAQKFYFGGVSGYKITELYPYNFAFSKEEELLFRNSNYDWRHPEIQRYFIKGNKTPTLELDVMVSTPEEKEDSGIVRVSELMLATFRFIR